MGKRRGEVKRVDDQERCSVARSLNGSSKEGKKSRPIGRRATRCVLYRIASRTDRLRGAGWSKESDGKVEQIPEKMDATTPPRLESIEQALQRTRFTTN